MDDAGTLNPLELDEILNTSSLILSPGLTQAQFDTIESVLKRHGIKIRARHTFAEGYTRLELSLTNGDHSVGASAMQVVRNSINSKVRLDWSRLDEVMRGGVAITEKSAVVPTPGSAANPSTTGGGMGANASCKDLDFEFELDPDICRYFQEKLRTITTNSEPNVRVFVLDF